MAIVQDSLESLDHSSACGHSCGLQTFADAARSLRSPFAFEDFALLESTARYSGCGLAVALLMGRRLVAA